MRAVVWASVVGLAFAGRASAHDTWVETNTSLVRVGDSVHVDVKLGNHGNNHRDFKLAGKISLDGCAVAVIAPGDKRYDLKDRLHDVGYAPKEGYWTTPFVTADPGLYCVVQSADGVVNHGKPVRSIRSAKSYFLAAASLDKPVCAKPSFKQPLGLPFELVLETSPVLDTGPGKPIIVRLLQHGKPLKDTVVSFIPRGTTLKEQFDDRYERKTDVQGRVSFTPNEGNVYLIVAHQKAPTETGKDYELTQYTATLTIRVPQLCPCCGE